jgi:hypothetical protein
MDMKDAVYMGLPIIAGISWALRLEGRQNAHERECAERQRRMDERHEMYKLHFARIDEKLDRLLDSSPAGRHQPQQGLPGYGDPPPGR